MKLEKINWGSLWGNFLSSFFPILLLFDDSASTNYSVWTVFWYGYASQKYPPSMVNILKVKNFIQIYRTFFFKKKLWNEKKGTFSDSITFDQSQNWKTWDSFRIAITMSNFNQIRLHLLPKMHVWSNHVLVNFHLEKSTKNLSYLCTSICDLLGIAGLLLCSVMA